jgi:hypothetical protein
VGSDFEKSSVDQREAFKNSYELVAKPPVGASKLARRLFPPDLIGRWLKMLLVLPLLYFYAIGF